MFIVRVTYLTGLIVSGAELLFRGRLERIETFTSSGEFPTRRDSGFT